MKSSRSLTMLALAVLASLFLQHAVRADQAEQSAAILNGSAAVPALSYVYYPVSVAGAMSSPHIVGHVEASGGSGNDITVMVFSQTDFTNWKNNHSVAPLYNSGQVTAADVNVPVAAGDYVVVLSNTFSAFTPKTVAGSLRLAWTPPSALGQLAGGGNGTSFMTVFIVLLAVAGMGGVAAWSVFASQAKKKTEAAAEKKAA